MNKPIKKNKSANNRTKKNLHPRNRQPNQQTKKSTTNKPRDELTTKPTNQQPNYVINKPSKEPTNQQKKYEIPEKHDRKLSEGKRSGLRYRIFVVGYPLSTIIDQMVIAYLIQ